MNEEPAGPASPATPSAVEPPAPKPPRLPPALRHVANAREGRNPPSSVASLLSMRQALANPQDPPVRMPSLAQRVLRKFAIRNKIVHAVEDGNLALVKREGDDPFLLPDIEVMRRKRSRRDVVLSEMAIANQLKTEDIVLLMATELREGDTLPEITGEDVLEFKAALLSASTMYNTHPGVSNVLQIRAKKTTTAHKTCYYCRKAHVSCEATRPCAVGFRGAFRRPFV